MKYQKKQEIKKKVLAVVALIMAILMVLSLLAPFTTFAAPVTEVVADEPVPAVEETAGSMETFDNNQFTVDLNVGFDGTYIVYKPMLVEGVVTNHGNAFHGELQVKSFTRATDTDKEYALYYQKLDLEPGSTKSVNMEVTMGNIQQDVEISLVNEKGMTVYQDHLFLVAKDPETVLTGVLSDSNYDLKYLSNLRLAEEKDVTMEVGQEASREYQYTVFLNEDALPNTVNILDSFSVLLIDDFDCSTLLKKQKEALKQWVLTGGTLLLGTGSSAQKTLKGLDFLADIQVEGTTTVSELFGVAGPIPLAKLKGAQVEALKMDSGNPIFSVVKVGSGHIVLSHFSLSETPMAGQATTLNSLQGALHQVAKSSFMVSSSRQGNDTDYLRYISRDFPPFETSSMYLIIGMIVVYILIVGPILYVFLKKKDKREKGWVIIPILSFVAMGVVFFLAQSSTYKNGIINTVACVEMQDGSSMANAEVGVSLKYSGRGDVVFTSDEQFPVSIPIEESSYTAEAETETPMYRILCGDTTEVTFLESPSWSTQYFKTQRTMDLGGNIEMTMAMKNDRFVGEITNHTNVNFYKVVLMFNGYLHEFDALEAGATLEVDISMEDLAKRNWQLYGRGQYEVIRKKLDEGEITRKEAFLGLIEEDLQRKFSREEENTALLPVAFYGYSDASLLGKENSLNGKTVLKNNVAMYHQNFSIELPDQEKFEVGLRGDVEDNSKLQRDIIGLEEHIYTKEDCELHVNYTIPDDIRVDAMQLNINSGDKQFISEYMEIYNMKTQQWDEVKIGEPINFINYIDEHNLVKITFHCPGDVEVKVPKLLIQGGGLHAGN